MTYDSARHRLVFVGGLHRSGTTLLTRLIGQHPSASVFDGTCVPADEGQHLQSVYPTAKAHGGPGRFGLDSTAHLTEESALCTRESAERLIESWSSHWDLERSVLVEKSPPNLIRARFLQGLFPTSSFVMILRHPIVVALATQKMSGGSLRGLLRHWLVSHETLARDRPHVDRLLVVTFEELVADPSACLGGIFQFLELEPCAVRADLRADSNAEYLARWRALTDTPRGRLKLAGTRYGLEARVARFGYSLRDLDRTPAPDGAPAPPAVAGS